MDGFPVFWLPHTGSQSSVIHHAVPLSCHMDGWDREQPERLKPALLCITFCLCTYSHCTLSPLTPIPASLDRETGRNAHCSLGASIDPANHFIYCLINADSHLYSRRSRPRSIRVWLTACLAECMFDWKRMKRTKHTLVHTHIHRD